MEISRQAWLSPLCAPTNVFPSGNFKACLHLIKWRFVDRTDSHHKLITHLLISNWRLQLFNNIRSSTPVTPKNKRHSPNTLPAAVSLDQKLIELIFHPSSPINFANRIKSSDAAFGAIIAGSHIDTCSSAFGGAATYRQICPKLLPPTSKSIEMETYGLVTLTPDAEMPYAITVVDVVHRTDGEDKGEYWD